MSSTEEATDAHPPEEPPVETTQMEDSPRGKKRPQPASSEDEQCSKRKNSTAPPPPPLPFVQLPYHGEHRRAVSAVAFAPGESICHTSALCLAASASADSSVKLWELTPSMLTEPSRVQKNLSPLNTLVGHSRGINDLAWSRKGDYIATASDDKTLRLWDVHTGDALVEFKGHANFCFSVAFNPQGNLLASGSFDETVKLWDVRSGSCVATLPAHCDPVTAVDFNRDGTCIASGSHDGLLRVWDTATGQCLKTLYAEGNPPVGYVKYSPNGKYVLAGTLDSTLRLWHMSSANSPPQSEILSKPQSRSKVLIPSRGGKCTKTYKGHSNTKYCSFAAFSVSNPSRQTVVAGSEDGMVYLYDLQSRKVRQVLKGHSDAVLAVAAHDKKEILASGGMTNDKTVRFWVPAKPED